MNWYYADQGRPAGPVDDAQLEQLRRSGTIADDTLVWCEGMANWAPYSQAKPGPLPVLPPVINPVAATLGADEATCVECGIVFARENMIRYGNAYVCANCKPVFMQKIAEGVAVSRGPAGSLSEQEILSREYRIEIGDAVSRSWKMFSENVGMCLGTVVVVGLIFVACWGASTVLGLLVPFANSFLSVLYTAPLSGGVAWFFLRLARGEPATVADGLAGLSRRYGRLVLLGLVNFGVSMVCMAPILIMAFAFGLSAGARGSRPPPDLVGGMFVGLGLAVLLALVVMICVNTLFIFSSLLIMDKGYRCWPALRLSTKMVARRWWMTLLFFIVASLLYGAGVLVFCVGLLVTGPLYIGMKAVLYDDNFRDLARQE